MAKIVGGIGLLYIVLSALTLSMAPDFLAMAIVALMIGVILAGYVVGMIPTVSFGSGFKRGLESIEQTLEVQAKTPWLTAQQVEFFFHQKTLDGLFGRYVEKYRQQEAEKIVPCDIEDFINEDSLALRSWQSVVAQIPGTLTSLGLLGTFIGLVTGIANIGFSSVDAALSSIEMLLSGIGTAFYTSIVGVIFSIVFNILYKLLWSGMLRQMGVFMERFHMDVLPSQEERVRKQRDKEMKLVLERLDRIPKDRGFSMAAQGGNTTVDMSSEQRLMPQIREGLKNGEFIFYIQPRCDLVSRRVISGEALVRWMHGDMGMISPAQFLPVVEQNGFIVRIDCYIWESVCRTIRMWIDAGKRPIPLAINISKTDLLAMDVATFFSDLIHKYRIPPRYLEIEVAENAFVQCRDVVHEMVNQMRQSGFRVVVDGFRGDISTNAILKQTEVDGFKLDLRFLEGKAAEVVPSICDQARKLNSPIIAEGIENTEQLTILRRCGCVEGQGYYFHKPMPVSEFENLMRHE